MAAFTRIEKGMRWYVMRDLKRANAKVPAYKLLEGMKMEVFVPMKWHLVTRKGIRIREEVPFIQDLLFVHETQTTLTPSWKRHLPSNIAGCVARGASQ